MQFLAHPNRIVECCICPYLMFVIKEIDQRVAIMQHPVSGTCKLSRGMFRVDRLSGYSEEVLNAPQEPAKVQVPQGSVTS